jgi:hypothetical protein
LGDLEDILKQDPGPRLDPAGGPPGEELLGIADDVPEDDDEDWDDEDEGLLT